MRTLTPWMLAGSLLLTQGCIFAIDADDDDKPWWADDDDDWNDEEEDEDDDRPDDEGRDDTDVEEPTPDVVVSVDIDTVQAGSVTLLLGTIDGAAASTDVEAVALEPGLEVLDFAPTGTRTFAIVVAADGDAEGLYDAWFDFGELGDITFDDWLLVEPRTDTDTPPYCTK